MRRLAVLMVEGTVLTRNLPEAERTADEVRRGGPRAAMVDLGDMHDARENEQGWSQAAKWYARAADRGNATAMVRLGILQQDGKGVLKDETAAANLYRKAADDGSSSGMHNLALLYDKGIGVDRRDPELAATLMLQAIDLGDQFSLKEMAQSSSPLVARFPPRLPAQAARRRLLRGRHRRQLRQLDPVGAERLHQSQEEVAARRADGLIRPRAEPPIRADRAVTFLRYQQERPV